MNLGMALGVRVVNWWRRKIGMWGIIGLWLPYLLLVAFFGGSFFIGPLRFIVSGQWFKLVASGYYSKPFPKQCVGCALDQPTVGKFMFWFLVFSTVSLMVALVIRLLSDFSQKRNRLAFAIPFGLVAVAVLTFFVAPASMLAHYISDLGFTPRRLKAAMILALWLAGWLAAAWLLLRRPRDARVAVPSPDE